MSCCFCKLHVMSIAISFLPITKQVVRLKHHFLGLPKTIKGEDKCYLDN